MRITIVTSLLVSSFRAFAFRAMASPSRAVTSSLAAIERPFGAWESPITSKAITSGSVRLGGVHVSDGSVYWLEGRPQEGGRNVLCRYDPEGKDKSERNGVDVTPKDSNVRTRVHEYGGGAVTFGKGNIFYSEFASQRLCQLVGGDVKPITPDGNRFRFADGVWDDSTKTICCVREDHEKPAPKDVVNEVVSVQTIDGSMKIMATGNE